MRCLTIGDLHGKRVWKTVDPEKYDRIIFLGDYLDSFTISDDEIIGNFLELLQFRREHPQKVVLLIGNHEMSYLDPVSCGATGYRPSIAMTIRDYLLRSMHLLNIAFQGKKYLWTHAGIHQGFYDQKIKKMISDEDGNLASTLERLFQQRYSPIFEVGYQRGGSRSDIGGPLWLDKVLLISKPLRGYHQIVGHTPVPTIKHYQPYRDDPATTVTLCDCVERGDGSFYEVEID